MARIFQDGFELGRPSTRPPDGSFGESLWKFLYANSNYPTYNIVTTASLVNSGVYALQVGSGSEYGSTRVCAAADLGASVVEHFGRAEIRSDVTGANTTFCGVLDGSLAHALSIGNLDGNLRIVLGTTEIGQIAGVFTVGAYNRIEWHFIVDSTNGLIEVKVNGNSLFTWEGNTRGARLDSIRYVAIGLSGATFLTTMNRWQHVYIDDVAVNDTAGSVNNSWCGKGSILLLRPKGIGHYSQFIPSNISLNNYEMVDDIPADGDTTYVKSEIAEEIDTYNMEELIADHGIDSTLLVVKAVQVCLTGRYEGVDAHFAPILRHGVTDEEGALIEMLNTYHKLHHQVFSVSPFTGLAWTYAEVDALEAGVKQKEHTHG